MGGITAGLGLANAASGFIGQKGQASSAASTTSFNTFLNAINAQASASSAQQDYELSMEQLALRMQQERVQSATKGFYYNKEKNAAVAEAKVRASEMGVTGNTLDALLGDLEMQNAERVTIARENSDAAIKQLDMVGKGEGAQLQSRLRAAWSSVLGSPSAPSSPSFGSLALGAASAGLDGFNAYNRLLRLEGGKQPA